ncbi:MAG: Uma2 family endonuclease [Gammaproteobacteria bacterium]|nr:Uma2 family endonuclease [Gammaproteobacteria bacterium]
MERAGRFDVAIQGEIISTTPIGSRHAAAVDRLNHLLLPALSHRAIIRVQQPVRLSDLSETEPDIAVVAMRSDFYDLAHPRPGDLYLLIEVADSSHHYDRDLKLPLYARHGVKEVWLVNIEAKILRVSRSPAHADYEQSFIAPDPRHMMIESLSDILLDLSTIFSPVR